jgi:predicted glycoside hydrolase/deacetylase ChbG (UPF0249 family)
MKFVIRADDVGYTPVHNIGTIKSMEEGLVTSADVMLDCSGTIEILKWLKEHPWISVGWHAHLWGSPVADPHRVPSMINESGRFVGRRDRKEKNQIKYEEALIELRAQMDRCVEILGRVPDTAPAPLDDSDLSKAIADVAQEYGIAVDFMSTTMMGNYSAASDRFISKNIHGVDPQYQYVGAMKHDEGNAYNPMNFYRDFVTAEMLESNNTYVTPWHPGYLDELVLSESSMTWCRVVDVRFLCSEEFKAYIRDHKIELVNFRDVIYGTKEYQNHLKLVNSDLYI